MSNEELDIEASRSSGFPTIVWLGLALLVVLAVGISAFVMEAKQESVSTSVPQNADANIEAPQAVDDATSEAPQDIDEPPSTETIPTDTHSVTNSVPTPAFKVASPTTTSEPDVDDRALSPAEQERQLALAKQAAELAERDSEAKLKLLEANLKSDRAELESLSKVEVSYAVEQWRKAWSDGDIERYLNFYSPDFQPAGDVALETWVSKRQQRVLPDKHIDLNLSKFDVSFNEQMDVSTVTFTQDYHSDGLSQTSRKQLQMSKQANGWKITSETELN